MTSLHEKKIILMREDAFLISQRRIRPSNPNEDHGDSKAIQEFYDCWDKVVTIVKNFDRIDLPLFNQCMRLHDLVFMRVMCGWLVVKEACK